MKRYLTIYFAIILFLLFLFAYVACTNYGFLQARELDDRDLATWNYEDGVIIGTQRIELRGSKDTCWLMLHGYTSTPLEMNELAQRVHEEFNDTVVVPRLQGHGSVPSNLEGTDASFWYRQAKTDLEQMGCNKVNLVGSSFGGMVAARLAEENTVNRLYLISPFFVGDGTYTNMKIKMLSGMLNYLKKKGSSINDPEAAKHHIAYLNMPLLPVKNSLMFSQATLLDAGRIDEPVLIQHSKGDTTAFPVHAQTVYDRVSTDDKQLLWYERSGHVLLQDYDRQDVIDRIIEFEKQRR